MLHEVAVKEFAKLVYSMWYHDTVCCISCRSVERRLSDIWKNFREGRNRYAEGRGESSMALEKYKGMVDTVDRLWDLFATEEKRRKDCEEEWSVTMSANEHRYYEDQKGPRLYDCDNCVDPVWYKAMLRRQRAREKLEQYRKERDEQFSFKNMNTIPTLLTEQGVISTDTYTSLEGPVSTLILEWNLNNLLQLRR